MLVEDLIEQTLILVKPDGVKRGLVGEIIKRLETTGLKLVALKMIKPSKALAEKHYPKDRKEFIEGMGKKTLENYQEVGLDPIKMLGTDNPHKIGLMIREWLIEYLTSDPVVAMVWQGPLAVSLVRKVAGNTLPFKAECGSIRGDLAFDSSALANTQKRAIKNLVHASGSKEEATYEIPLWFSKEEIVSYQRIEELVML
ncbi:MAG: nucleoside-diphosphate kinase [Patescibacteria group bacterium]|nr:nucleoside-diphosphate kinase [Patescibacteria group bacterium]